MNRNQRRLARKEESRKPPSTDEAMAAAVAHHMAGRLPEAVAAYRTVLTLAPRHPVALGNLGFALLSQGQVTEAEQRCRDAVTAAPGYEGAHANLGAVLAARNLHGEAAACFQRAVDLKPDYVMAHNNLGVMLTQLGRAAEAEGSLRRAIALKSDYAEAHCNLGLALERLARPDEAAAAYAQAVALRPAYPEALNNLGIVLVALGRADEAEACCRRALGFAPAYAEAMGNLGAALQAQGRNAEAEACYRRALELNPALTGMHKNLGLVLQDLGRMEDAVVSLQHAFAARTGLPSQGDPLLRPAASTLLMEITNKCNFHCAFCPSDSQQRAIGFMDFALATRIIDEVAQGRLVDKVAMHLMGEPTLHPRFFDILAHGASRNVKLELVTNGSTLTPKLIPALLDSLVGSIVVSLQTPDAETYPLRGATGVPWERYITGIRALVKEHLRRVAERRAIRHDIEIRVMVTADANSCVDIVETGEQEHRVYQEWCDLIAETERDLGLAPFPRPHLAESGMDLGMKRLQQGLCLNFWKAFSFANSRASEGASGEPDTGGDGETRFCNRPFTDFAILWNGDITQCCMDYDGELKIGAIAETPLLSAMDSPAARELRARMLSRQPLPRLCRQCQSGELSRE